MVVAFIDDVERLVDSPVTPSVIDYVVSRVTKAVQIGLGRPLSSSPSSSSSSSSSSPSSSSLPTTSEFTTFTTSVIRRAEVKMAVVLGTLVYIERAMPYLRISIEEYSLHRVLLGALILSSKYLNDSSLKNAHWALCTQLFGKRDIGRIEREFLVVLDWELGVKEGELLRVGLEVDEVVRRDTNASVKSGGLTPIDTRPSYKTHHRGGNYVISPSFSSTSSCDSLSPPSTPPDGFPLSAPAMTLPPVQPVSANNSTAFTDFIDVDVDVDNNNNHPHSVKKLLDSFPLPTLPTLQDVHDTRRSAPAFVSRHKILNSPYYLPTYQFPEIPIEV